jgi:predicted PurR-regulated permease PerM
MNQERSSALQWLAIAALLAALTYALTPILTPFVAAAILAYLCAPLMEKLCKLKIPRSAAALLVMALLSGAIVLLALLLLPVLQREAWALATRLPTLVDAIRIKIVPLLQQYMHLEVQWDGEAVRNLLGAQLQQGAGNMADKVLPWLGGGSAALLNLLMSTVLLPVLLFYLLCDWPLLLANLGELIPRRHYRLSMQIAAEADAVLAEFLRGQLLVMLVMSVFYTVGLWYAGLEFALPIGLLAGMLVFIPYVGMITGLLLALLASMGQFNTTSNVLLVCGIFGGGHVLESMVFTPRLVGERIGLHPLVVIFALLAFGQIFGFFGVLLALPMSAVLLVCLRHTRAWYLDSPLYRE